MSIALERERAEFRKKRAGVEAQEADILKQSQDSKAQPGSCEDCGETEEVRKRMMGELKSAGELIVRRSLDIEREASERMVVFQEEYDLLQSILGPKAEPQNGGEEGGVEIGMKGPGNDGVETKLTEDDEKGIDPRLAEEDEKGIDPKLADESEEGEGEGLNLNLAEEDEEEGIDPKQAAEGEEGIDPIVAKLSNCKLQEELS
jgi:hypothetical protein